MTRTKAGQGKSPTRQNLMHPVRWVPPDASALLDVGCSAGELLCYCSQLYPAMRLAGVEINPAALGQAKSRVPHADLRSAGAEALPFADESFDCVTCIEVLEHIPGESRASALSEMHRVLRPGGRLVLRVPHAGIFAWLDPNNMRFRLPAAYRLLIGDGKRDAGYTSQSKAIIWHYHFSLRELLALAGDGWEVEASRAGGLLLVPVLDMACWPLYRMNKTGNVLFQMIQRAKAFDLGCNYGRLSYDILLVLRRN